MQKHTFNVLGVLLATALLVLLCVGGVSAEPIKICDDVNVDIIQGTYFSDFGGDYEIVGNAIPFSSDLGVLALASMSLYEDYTFNPGTVTDGKYNITNLGGQAANSTHQWIVFVNQSYFGENDKQTLTPVSQRDVVTAFFVAKGNTTYADAQRNATHSVNVTINSIKAVETKKVSVSLTAGTFTKQDVYGVSPTIQRISGLGALQAAAETLGLTYNISNWGGGSIGLVDINDVGSDSDYSKTGYGWGVYNNGVITPTTLDAVPVTSGDKLTLYYTLSAYTANPTGLTANDGNYLGSSLCVLEITITSAEGTESAIGPSNANILWAVDMADTYAEDNYEFVPDGSPVVKDGKVYFTAWGGSASQNGVYCFDATTGSKVWAKTGITSRSGVTIHGDYLYVGYMKTENGDHIGGVKCLDIKTGNEVEDTGAIYKNPTSGYVGLTSTPLIFNERVWIYSPTSYEDNAAILYSYDTKLSASSKQSIKLGGTCGGMYASPTASPNGIIYVPAGSGISAVDTATNTVLWSFNANAGSGTVGTPVYHNYIVYFIVSDFNNPNNGKLYAVDTTTYSSWSPNSPYEKWNVSHTAEFSTTPVVDDTTIYVTGLNGLTAYAVSDGTKKWQHNGGNAYRASPTLANGVVYYGTYKEGTLYAVSTTGGSEVWKLKPVPGIANRNTIFEARPAVSDGVLYVGCEGASTFYAISDAGDPNTAYLLELKQLQQQQLALQEEANELQERELQLLQQELYYLQQQGQSTQQSDGYHTLINPGSGTVTHTTNHPAYPKTTFTFDRMTAAGVLLASGNNVVTAERWGGLYIVSINGIGSDTDTTGGWMYQVNGKSVSSMPNNYRVTYGDSVVFYYSTSMDSTPATSPHVHAFKVSTNTATTPIKSEPVKTPTPTLEDIPPVSTEPVPTEILPTETTAADTPAPLAGLIFGLLACIIIRQKP